MACSTAESKSSLTWATRFQCALHLAAEGRVKGLVECHFTHAGKKPFLEDYLMVSEKGIGGN